VTLGVTSTQGDARFSGRMGGSQDNGLQYPSPFFDIAHTYLPATVKQMFRWCRYYFLVNPLINAVVFKMSEYPITDILFDTERPEMKQRWTSFLLEQLRYRAFQIEVGLDYYTYGNALVSIFYPFIKILECPSCKSKHMAKDSTYRFQNFQFHMQCPNCGNHGPVRSYDHYIRAPKGIRLLRWNPENVDIRYNEITGEYEYYYDIPNQIRNDIIIGKKSTVETVPQLFIDALKLKKAVVFSKDNIYHFKRPTLAGKDRGWGTPMILPVLKDTFYLQILRKAQECVSLSSEIETPSGLVLADDVQVGDLVRTHTGNWREVEDKWYRDAREDEIGRKITLTGLRGFPTTYSPQHPVFTIRRNEEARRSDTKDSQRSSVILRNPHLYEEVLCPAGQLGVGEYVLYPRCLPVGETSIDVAKYTGLRRTDDFVYSGCSESTASAFEALERGDSVKHDNPGRVAKRAVKEGRVPKRMPSSIPMTKDLAYILGWYAGDGSCGSRHVNFSLSKKDNFVPLLDAIHNAFSVEATVEYGTTVNTVVLSDVIVRKLIKGLIPGTARQKRAPNEILTGTDEVKLSYLKGLWEADGTSTTASIAVTSSSRDQAYDAYRLMLHFGCIAAIGSLKPTVTWIDGREVRSKGSYNVTVCNSSADRLWALWESGYGPEVVSGKSGFFWKDYFAARICSVEEVEEEQYIDFKVAVDTTFCTPGTATKNSIALEHIVPLRVIFPQAGTATSDPYTSVNLQDWRDQVASEIKRWRSDSNYIPIMPLPLGHQSIGGDGRALLLSQEIRVWSEQIVAGMGVPTELIFGGLSYSGSNVSLRMLENTFLGYLQDHLSLLKWVIRQTSSWLGWPSVRARFKPFKMADDLQRKAYLFQLNQSGKLSDESLLSDADYDSYKEDEIMEREAARRAGSMKKQRLLQAEIEGEAQMSAMKWQNKAQEQQMQMQMAIQNEAAKDQAAFQGQQQSQMMQEQMAQQQGQEPPPSPPELQPAPRQPELLAGSPQVQSPLTMQSVQRIPPGATGESLAGQQNVDILLLGRQIADRVSSLGPSERPRALAVLKQKQPQLHDIVLGLMAGGGPTRSAQAAARPLPEQKPARRGPESSLV